MKPVSKEYIESMAQPLRNQSVAEVVFKNIDPDAAKDNKWLDNGHEYWSEVDTLDYDYIYPLDTPYTLELNRMVFGDSSSFLPRKGEAVAKHGFISNIVSAADGTMTNSTTLTRVFTKERTFPGLTIIFDTRAGEAPSAVTTTYYRERKVVATTDTVITDVTALIDLPALRVDEVELKFHSQLPYHRVRVEQIIFGIVKIFTNKNLAEIIQTNDVDPLSRRLPQEEYKFTIWDYEHKYDYDNPAGIWHYISEHPPVENRFGYVLPSGEIEWLRSDKYIMAGKPVFKNNRVTFSATGMCNTLKAHFYKSKLGDKTLYDMAVEVLTDAQLTPLPTGENPWVVSDKLRQIHTVGVLPIASHCECLQLIAHAAMSRLYTDDNNVIHIEPFNLAQPPVSALVVDNNTISERSQAVTKIEKLREVLVTVYNLVQANTGTTKLYEATTTGETVHAEFDLAQDIQISVSGGSLISSTIYAQAVDLVLSPGGTKTVTITGRALKAAETIITLQVATEGEIDTESNPLITSESTALALAQHVAEYLKLRTTYDMNYRGNPELEVGDVVEVQTQYSSKARSLILTDEIRFNGALRGKLKVKRLDGGD